jgi:TPR repeat protein
MSDSRKKLFVGLYLLLTCAPALAGIAQVCSKRDSSPDLFELYYKWNGGYEDYLHGDLSEILVRADKGDSRAKAVVAKRILNNENASVSVADALLYLKSAKRAGDPLALYFSGMLERKGHLLKQDLAEAHLDFQKAADLDYVPAKASVAADYMLGAGVEVDFAKARSYAQAALDDGYIGAAQLLGVIYSKGLGVPQDQAKGFEFSRKAASIGDPAAQFDVARALVFGEGVSADSDAAYQYAQQAYCSGLKLAGMVLGKIELAKHSTEGTAAAIEFYSELSEIGNFDADLVLSDIYLDPTFGKQDVNAAMSYLSKATEAGSTEGKYRWGAALLRYGRSNSDYRLAEKLLLESAESGDTRAQYDLGVGYARGVELAQDTAKARSWFERAASAGNEQAKAALVEMQQESKKK